MENIIVICAQLLPVLGVVVLILLMVLLYEVIKIVKRVNTTLDKAHLTIDLVDDSLTKVQSPLDTAVKISGTVDKAHDATVKAAKDAREFVVKNTEAVKEKLSEVLTKKEKEEEVKEPGPEDIIGGEYNDRLKRRSKK